MKIHSYVNDYRLIRAKNGILLHVRHPVIFFLPFKCKFSINIDIHDDLNECILLLAGPLQKIPFHKIPALKKYFQPCVARCLGTSRIKIIGQNGLGKKLVEKKYSPIFFLLIVDFR